MGEWVSPVICIEVSISLRGVGSRFPSMWVLRIKVGLSSIMTNAFTQWATSSVLISLSYWLTNSQGTDSEKEIEYHSVSWTLCRHQQPDHEEGKHRRPPVGMLFSEEPCHFKQVTIHRRTPCFLLIQAVTNLMILYNWPLVIFISSNSRACQAWWIKSVTQTTWEVKARWYHAQS